MRKGSTLWGVLLIATVLLVVDAELDRGELPDSVDEMPGEELYSTRKTESARGATSQALLQLMKKMQSQHQITADRLQKCHAKEMDLYSQLRDVTKRKGEVETKLALCHQESKSVASKNQEKLKSLNNKHQALNDKQVTATEDLTRVVEELKASKRKLIEDHGTAQRDKDKLHDLKLQDELKNAESNFAEKMKDIRSQHQTQQESMNKTCKEDKEKMKNEHQVQRGTLQKNLTNCTEHLQTAWDMEKDEKLSYASGDNSYAWPEQDATAEKLFPTAKGTISTVVGQMGQTRSFEPGIRQMATFELSRRPNEECMLLPLLSGSKSRYAPGTGTTMLREEYAGGKHVNFYTIKAARVMQIEPKTGHMTLVKDLCRDGFFKTDQLLPFPAETAKWVKSLNCDRHHIHPGTKITSGEAVAAGAAWQVQKASHAEVYLLVNARVHADNERCGSPPQTKQVFVAVTKDGGTRSYGPTGISLPFGRGHGVAGSCREICDRRCGCGSKEGGMSGAGILSMTTTTVAKPNTSKEAPKVNIFVATVNNAWTGEHRPHNYYDSSTIYSARMSHNCKCVDSTCATLCPLKFKAMGTVPHGGVISMQMYQNHLYFLQVAWQAVPPHYDFFQSQTNSLSVAPVKMHPSSGDWLLGGKTLLAGGTVTKNDVFNSKKWDGYKPVDTSIDGYGTDASFLFYYIHKPAMSKWDRFAGASLTMYPDIRTNKTYVLVSEGSSHKIRLVDVSERKASSTKVTTVGVVVGAQELAMGGTDDAYIFSKYGMILNLDLYPVIPCANLWNITREANDAWHKTAAKGISNHTYNLLRKSASKDGEKQPWLLTVQKKTKPVSYIAEGARLSKIILCSRPSKDRTGVNPCCVKKKTAGHGNLTTAQEAEIQAMLTEF